MIPLKPYKNKLSKSQKIFRLLWAVVWSIFFKTTPSWCLRRWRIFLLRLFGAKVGKACAVYPSCKIWAPWNVELGDYVCLASGVDCYSVSKVTIGDRATISQDSFICTASHDFEHPDNPLICKQVAIKNFVWVAAGAFVGPGVIVGEGAVVGARAVVTKNVEPWTVVAGNPAKFIKKRVMRTVE